MTSDEQAHPDTPGADDPPAVVGRARRMSVGGKLSFRRRVPEIEADADLPLVQGGDDPPRLDELVPAGAECIEIEVGPGKGGFLVAATEARPRSFFLGIEAAPGYAAFAAARLQEAARANAQVLVDNASLFLRDRTRPGSVDRLHVYFPDPWPKRRHRQRRFFNDSVPPTLHRALKDDGLLLVATDNPGYAGQIARVLGSSPLFCRDEDLEDELRELGPGHAFSPTNFERKYRQEGRIIRQFAFRREPGAA
jgi:tRNA (guanine-N7-)-methyltransferase